MCASRMACLEFADLMTYIRFAFMFYYSVMKWVDYSATVMCGYWNQLNGEARPKYGSLSL